MSFRLWLTVPLLNFAICAQQKRSLEAERGIFRLGGVGGRGGGSGRKKTIDPKPQGNRQNVGGGDAWGGGGGGPWEEKTPALVFLTYETQIGVKSKNLEKEYLSRTGEGVS